MNPYDILSVSKTATVAQIKSAYRRLAKQHHPDMGTDGVEFERLSLAYAVLRDPLRRRDYDLTGNIDETGVVQVQQRMYELLAGLFNAAIESCAKTGQSFKHFDLMQSMRDNAARNFAESQQASKNLDKAISDRTVLLERIIRKGDGQNLFVEMLNQQLGQMVKTQKQHTVNIAAWGRAIEELAHYKSEVELIQAAQVMRWGAGAFSDSSTTSNYIFGGR